MPKKREPNARKETKKEKKQLRSSRSIPPAYTDRGSGGPGGPGRARAGPGARGELGVWARDLRAGPAGLAGIWGGPKPPISRFTAPFSCGATVEKPPAGTPP